MKMDEVVEQLDAALRLAKANGVFFITITRKGGTDEDDLHHFQCHTPKFPVEDLLPSLEEVTRLVVDEHPELSKESE